MDEALIALIEGIISTVAEAQSLWSEIKPILQAGGAPTAEQWASLNAQADAAHAAVAAGQ